MCILGSSQGFNLTISNQGEFVSILYEDFVHILIKQMIITCVITIVEKNRHLDHVTETIPSYNVSKDIIVANSETHGVYNAFSILLCSLKCLCFDISL